MKQGPDDVAWGLAKCKTIDPDSFFPQRGSAQRQAEAAKKICNGSEETGAVCPILIACREYALDLRISHGVWGGLSEPQRVKLARSRREAVTLRQRESEEAAQRRSDAARIGWVTRRTHQLQMEQAARAATRSRRPHDHPSTASKSRRTAAA